jgi:hypothetical protein
MEADDLCTSELPSAQDIQDVWKVSRKRDCVFFPFDVELKQLRFLYWKMEVELRHFCSTKINLSMLYVLVNSEITSRVDYAWAHMSPSIILSSLKELAFAHFCFVAKWQPPKLIIVIFRLASGVWFGQESMLLSQLQVTYLINPV